MIGRFLKVCKTTTNWLVSKTTVAFHTAIFQNQNSLTVSTIFSSQACNFGTAKILATSRVSKFKCLVPVGMLPERGSPGWEESAKSWCLPMAPVCSLHLIWRTCDAALNAAMPYLDCFSPSFFLANSKLHFCSLLLQKTKFSGLKAKDVYHSHPYLKDIIWLLEQTHLWASVHISTHVAVIYPSRPNKRLIIFYEIDQIK